MEGAGKWELGIGNGGKRRDGGIAPYRRSRRDAGGHAGTRDPTGGGFIETALPAVAQERALPIPDSLKTEGGFLG